MNITYNGLLDPSSDMVTFTNVPNILKVDADITGSYCTIIFFCANNIKQTVTADTQYYVTVLGQTVTNVMSPEDARNKRFYCSNNSLSTAMSLCKALRNCSSLEADFDIYVRENDSGVVLKAKRIGSKLSTSSDVDSNIPNQLMGRSVTDGESYSDLYNAKIDVNVYSDSSYITTLEKNFYDKECAFDMSPVLATLSEHGKTTPYNFTLQAVTEDGEFLQLGTVSGNSTVGYLANQSDKYIVPDYPMMMINKNRDMILYTYDTLIPYSILCPPSTYAWNYTIKFLDSSYNVIESASTIGNRSSYSLIYDTNISIPISAYPNTYYVDVQLQNQDPVRFNVIKPLRATEYYQRVEWRNEYGGISFFDFTGARSESDTVDIETYEKNIWDYYDTDYFEKKKIYKNEYEKQVTLTSHLMEEKGKYIFNSLMRSTKVWTTVNNTKYYIIPKSIEINEDQTYNNIYTAKLTYTYSDIS